MALLGQKKFLVILSVLMPLTLASCGQIQSEVYYRRGGRAHSRGDFKTAIELYQKSIQLSPTNPEIHYDLGIAYLDSHEYVQAKKQIQKLKDMDQVEMAALLQQLMEKGKSL